MFQQIITDPAVILNLLAMFFTGLYIFHLCHPATLSEGSQTACATTQAAEGKALARKLTAGGLHGH